MGNTTCLSLIDKNSNYKKLISYVHIKVNFNENIEKEFEDCPLQIKFKSNKT